MDIVRKTEEPLLKINTQQEVEYLTFPALEESGFVEHLFSTRHGGVSEGEFASMNLSFTRGDKKESVLTNYERIAKILHCSLEDFVCSDQTHTTNIRKVTSRDRGKGVVYKKDYTDIDGLITDEPGLVLCTFFADCVPLFFLDPVHKAIGLTHSGWRGTVGRIGQYTLDAMNREYQTKPEDVIAAIGPSICVDCYEVSEDVAVAFMKAFGIQAAQEEEQFEKGKDILYKKPTGKYQLDLWQSNLQVLLEAGVQREHISVTDMCTNCNPQYLFSHRASMGRRGNLGAFLKIKG